MLKKYPFSGTYFLFKKSFKMKKNGVHFVIERLNDAFVLHKM
jgi:hypothetical protein